MIRPTLKAVLLVLAFFLLSIISFALIGWFPIVGVILMIITLILLTFDYIASIPYRLLNLDYTLTNEIYIGTSGSFKITTKPTKWRFDSTLYFQLKVDSLLETPPIQELKIVYGKKTDLKIELKPNRRGIAHIHKLDIVWEGPLGLIETRKSYNIEADVYILPNINLVKEIALKYFSRDAFWGFKTQHLVGDGSEFTALREYVPGMDIRSLDWKHSAKHRKLISKEFQIERNHNVIFVFDTGYLMSEMFDGISYLDHSINAALVLTYVALKKGDKVGIFTFDETIRNRFKPIRGIYGFKNIQQKLTEVDYQSTETNFTLGLSKLNLWLNRRSLLILFTDFVDTITAELMIENVGYLISKHLVIFVSFKNSDLYKQMSQPPETMDKVMESIVANEFLKDRRKVFNKLKQLGVHCLEVESKELSAKLLNKYISIKQLELI